MTLSLSLNPQPSPLSPQPSALRLSLSLSNQPSASASASAPTPTLDPPPSAPTLDPQASAPALQPQPPRGPSRRLTRSSARSSRSSSAVASAAPLQPIGRTNCTLPSLPKHESGPAVWKSMPATSSGAGGGARVTASKGAGVTVQGQRAGPGAAQGAWTARGSALGSRVRGPAGSGLGAVTNDCRPRADQGRGRGSRRNGRAADGAAHGSSAVCVRVAWHARVCACRVARLGSSWLVVWVCTHRNRGRSPCPRDPSKLPP